MPVHIYFRNLVPFHKHFAFGVQGFRVEDRESACAQGEEFAIRELKILDNASGIDAQESKPASYSAVVYM